MIKVSKIIGALLANLAYNTNRRNPESKYEYSHDHFTILFQVRTGSRKEPEWPVTQMYLCPLGNASILPLKAVVGLESRLYSKGTCS